MTKPTPPKLPHPADLAGNLDVILADESWRTWTRKNALLALDLWNVEGEKMKAMAETLAPKRTARENYAAGTAAMICELMTLRAQVRAYELTIRDRMGYQAQLERKAIGDDVTAQ